MSRQLRILFKQPRRLNTADTETRPSGEAIHTQLHMAKRQFSRLNMTLMGIGHSEHCHHEAIYRKLHLLISLVGLRQCSWGSHIVSVVIIHVLMAIFIGLFIRKPIVGWLSHIIL